MHDQSLADALTLQPLAEGGLQAEATLAFSNAPLEMDPQKGGLFGGLLAALSVGAARRALDVRLPLRTLTIQYLAAPRFEPMTFEARELRGGRNVAYAGISGGQADRPAVQALATFGRDHSGPDLAIHRPELTAREACDHHPLDPRYAPWFTRHIAYAMPEGPRLFGQNAGGDVVLRTWMRCSDGAALDEARLLFLLDGLYPTYWTALPAPPHVAASVDLRADLVGHLTPDTSPDGWAFFEFRTQDLGGGWAVEDGWAFAPDGRLLALVRQRRKLMPIRLTAAG